MDDKATFDDDHFDNAAADFARFLPLIAPVTAAIRAHLPQLEPGSLLVDLACGTGEPGLTLAREMPEVQVLGVDSSANMIAIAEATAGREQLANARFEVSPIDGLDMADATAAAAISRFGALQFGEPEETSRELSRILAPHAPFSVAVWEDTAANTMIQLSVNALSRHVGTAHAAGEQLDRLAVAGRRETWLRQSGLSQVDSELFQWDYQFPDTDAAWAMIASKATFGGLVERLGSDERDDVRHAFDDALRPFQTSGSAGYVIPQTCRLIWGAK